MTVGASVQHGASVHWGVVDSPWGLGEPGVVLGSRKLLVDALGAAVPLLQGLRT